MSDVSKMKITDQFKTVYDPKDPEGTIVPTMPLLVAKDGIIGEAKSVRGAISLVIGNEYLDSEDALDEWYLRLDRARMEAMKALMYNKEIVVCDSRKGIIPNNYAIGKGDPDYQIEPDEDIDEYDEILIDNERLFLLTLAKIGAIRILERDDSYIFRPHEKWAAINGGETKKCSGCIHGIENEGKTFCSVYCGYCKENMGAACESFSVSTPEGQKEYTGGDYIEVCEEYGAEKLIQLFR